MESHKKEMIVAVTFIVFLNSVSSSIVKMSQFSNCNTPGSLLIQPPEFPDIRDFFSQTIGLLTPPWKPESLLDTWTTDLNCTCSVVLKSNNHVGVTLADINASRCDSNRYNPVHCPPPPTTTTTTTTTTHAPTTVVTFIPTIPTQRPSVGTPSVGTVRPIPNTSKSSPSATTTKGFVPGSPSSSAISSSTLSPSDASTTTTSGRTISTTPRKPVPTTGVLAVVGNGTESRKMNVIMVASIVAGVIIILVVAIVCFVYRRQLCARHGVPPKHKQFSRQRSDCIPISPPSPGISEPQTPSMSMNGSIGLINPGYEIDADSQDSKYYYLNDQPSDGFINLSYDTSTLKALEHPHALNPGGFGESSTDLTLKRKKGSTLRKSPPKTAPRNSSYIKTDSNHNNKNTRESNPLPTLAINMDEGKSSTSSRESKKKSKKSKKADRVSGPQEEWNKVAGSEIIRANQQSHMEDLLNEDNSHLFVYGEQDMSTFGRGKKKQSEQLANAGPAPPKDDLTKMLHVAVIPEKTAAADSLKPLEHITTPSSITASVTSLPGSIIIAPPPEFQDLSKGKPAAKPAVEETHDELGEDAVEVEHESSSGYSSGVAEEVVSNPEEKEIPITEPPTAVVQPSVKDLKAQFEVHNENTLPKGKPNGTLKKNIKPAVTATASVPLSNGKVENGLPSSFLWNRDRPQSVIPKHSSTSPQSQSPAKNSFLWSKPIATVAPNTEMTIL